MNFPKPETCLKCIDSEKGLFGDSEFVYVEHLCGAYGDRTEFVLEKRDGRESNGIDIVSAPTVIEMIKYMDKVHRYGFENLMERACYVENPCGDYDKLTDYLLQIVCYEIEKQEKK
jgi:hypothetical protein